MAARFTKLSHALDKGVESMTPKAGIEQIEYWENELRGVEVSGVKGLLHDLGSLKTKLAADEPDAEGIKTLLDKIGGETGRIAGRADDEAIADKLKDVGERLQKAA